MEEKLFVEQIFWLLGEKEYNFLMVKLIQLNPSYNKEVIRWSVTQESGPYAQDVINRFVNEESLRSATPTRCAVLSSRMD